MALFDVLPTELFKPLASPSRHFYADLLLFLHERTFSAAADAPRRSEVLAELAQFQARWESRNGMAAEEEGEARATSPEDRARAVYQRLVDTGWLIEHKDRYIRLVDLDPDASGLLHVLSEIERGESRTYGGAVVGVLSALESAAMHPSERSENVRNAVRGARDFLAHMRMVSVSLRKVEERIVRQDTLREVFRHFFEDFVQRHLIADFKTLHTKDNPFRFRASIIRQAQAMASNPLTMFALGEAYWREGRAPNAGAGERAVQEDLAAIIAIFEGTEAHLAAIDATAARIERRIMNTARYMDRAARRSESRLLETLKAVAAREGDPGARSPLAASGLPFGPSHIPTPRRERPPVQQSSLRKVERDPAFEAFQAAKADYVRRTRVTPQRLLDFVAAALGRSHSMRGSEIPILSVDDFVSFQRLRELPSIFDGALARRYEIEFLPERLSNGWVECQDFVIRKRKRTEIRDAA